MPRPKELFRHLDEWSLGVFDAFDGPEVLEHAAEQLVRGPGAELGVRGVRVRVGDPGDSPREEAAGRCIRLEAFRRSYLFDLDLASDLTEEEAELLLSTLHSVLAMRLVQRTFGSTMREAAEIQRSLLSDTPPHFGGYDLGVRCQPTDEVGGDLYDFLELDEDTLGLAVGDASGHGLPAALLVRDVVVGLRMGMEKELRPEHVLTRLNRVIHSSSLSSCFVSLFYAELEQNGNLFYFNAGHEPPLLFQPGGVVHLARGGPVVGPLRDARFKRHFAHVDHAATLVICTDGLLERRNASGELFGLERLTRAVDEVLGQPSPRVVDHVFATAQAFGGSSTWEDDATLLVVRRLP